MTNINIINFLNLNKLFGSGSYPSTFLFNSMQNTQSGSQVDFINISDEAIDDIKDFSKGLKNDGNLAKFILKNFSQYSGKSNTLPFMASTLGKGGERLSTLLDGLNEIGDKQQDQGQAALKIGEGATGTLSAGLDVANKLGKTAGKEMKNFSGLGLLAGGLGLVSETFDFAASVKSFQETQGDKKNNAAIEIAKNTGDLAKIGGELLEQGAKGIKAIFSSEKMIALAPKLGSAGAKFAAWGAVLSGGMDLVKGGKNIYSGISEYGLSKSPDAKAKVKGQIADGVCDVLSGGFSMASGFCAATGVGIPAAVVLGGLSAGVQGGKFLYDNCEPVRQVVNDVAGALTSGAKNLAGVVSSGVQKAMSSAEAGVKKAAGNASLTAKKTVSTALSGAKKLADSVSSGVETAVNTAKAGVKKAAGNASLTAKKTVSTVLSGAKKLADSVSSRVKTAVNTAKAGVKKAAGNVSLAAKKIVSTALSGAKKVGDTVSSGVQKAIKSISSLTSGSKKAMQ